VAHPEDTQHTVPYRDDVPHLKGEIQHLPWTPDLACIVTSQMFRLVHFGGTGAQAIDELIGRLLGCGDTRHSANQRKLQTQFCGARHCLKSLEAGKFVHRTKRK
jgi:hypothetical protein